MRVVCLFLFAAAVSGCIYPNAVYVDLPQGGYEEPAQP